jgi:Zinc finger, C3HC4 type (RING finger)
MRNMTHLDSKIAPEVDTTSSAQEDSAILRVLTAAGDAQVALEYVSKLTQKCGVLQMYFSPTSRPLQLPLNTVYIALKGDTSNQLERLYASLLLEDEVSQLSAAGEDGSDEKVTHRDARNEILSHNPYSLTIMEQGGYQPDALRLRPAGRKRTSATESINLGQAFRRFRSVVILGDPGSGKTTLARWLTFKLARALLRQEDRIVVPADQVDPDLPSEPPASSASNDSDLSLNAAATSAASASMDAPSSVPPSDDVQQQQDSKMTDLGPTRLPLYVRVSNFADTLKREPDLTLHDFIARLHLDEHGHLYEHASFHSKGTAQTTASSASVYSSVSSPIENPPSVSDIPADATPLGRAFLRCLHTGHLVIILDGLDEIVAKDMRVIVVHAVQEFASKYVNDAGSPALDGGNQLLVTSRIVGYHANPLQPKRMNQHIAHVTVQKMSDISINKFVDVWMAAVHPLLTMDDVNRLAHTFRIKNWAHHTPIQRAQRMARNLKRTIHDGSRVGLLDFARNPLLLNIIIMVYMNGSLPQQRSMLYEYAVNHLMRVWHNRADSNKSDRELERLAGHSADVDMKCTDEFTPEELHFVLPPIAYFMHEHYSSGLIPEQVLLQLLTYFLHAFGSDSQVAHDTVDLDDKTVPAIKQLCSSLPGSLSHRAKLLMGVMQRTFGVMTERGEELYGFVHLTFEEFLAGAYMLRNRENAASFIRNKLDHPRWTEPIILALGFANTHWSTSEFYSLISDIISAASSNIASFVTGPTAPLLVARAMAEMHRVDTSVLSLLLKKLLTLYTNPNIRRFYTLRDEIEIAFDTLHRRRPDDVELFLAHQIIQAESSIPAFLQDGSADVIDPLLGHPTPGAVAPSHIHDSPARFSSKRVPASVAPGTPPSKPPAACGSSPGMPPLPPRLVRNVTSPTISAKAHHHSDSKAHAPVLSRPQSYTHNASRSTATTTGASTSAASSVGAFKRYFVVSQAEANLSCAATCLIRRFKWYTYHTVYAISKALELNTDLRSWQWPVHAAARELISCANEHHSCYSSVSNNYSSSTSKAALRKLKALMFGRHSLLSPVMLPMRQFLQKNHAAAQRIAQNPSWMTISIALYGGLRDLQIPAIHQRYRECASYLQMDSQDRQPYAEFLRYQWKGDDTVYAIAAHLDTNTQFASLKKVLKLQPTFDASFMWCDSPLTPFIIPALEQGTSIKLWSKRIVRLLRATADEQLQVDIIIALGLLGYNIEKLVAIASYADNWQREQHRQDRNRATAAAARAAELHMQTSYNDVVDVSPVNSTTKRTNAVCCPSDASSNSLSPNDSDSSGSGNNQIANNDTTDLNVAQKRRRMSSPRASGLLHPQEYRTLWQRVASKFECCFESLRDPVARSSTQITAYLQQLTYTLEESRWKDVVQAAMRVLLECSASAKLNTLYPRASAEVKPYILAEVWAEATVSMADDALYATALMVDRYWTVEKPSITKHMLISSLYHIHESVMVRYTRRLLSQAHTDGEHGSANQAAQTSSAGFGGSSPVSRFVWLVNSLPIEFANASDQLLEVYSVLRGTCPNIALLRSAFWDRIRDMITHQEIHVELLAFYLREQGQYIQEEYWKWTHDTTQLGSVDRWYPRFHLIRSAMSLRNPYFHARAMIALTDLVSETIAARVLIHQAYARASAVESPVRKALVLEMMLKRAWLRPEMFDGIATCPEVLDAALAAARSVMHLSQSVRLLLRLTFHAPSSMHESIIGYALQKISDVHHARLHDLKSPNAHTCIDELVRIKPFVFVFPTLEKKWRATCMTEKDPWERAKLADDPSFHLHHATTLHGRPAWTILATACRAASLQRRSSSMHQPSASTCQDSPQTADTKTNGLVPAVYELSHDSPWLQLLDENTYDDGIARLQRADVNGGVLLTSTATLVCDRLFDDERDISDAIQYVSHAPPEVLPAVRRWFAECTRIMNQMLPDEPQDMYGTDVKLNENLLAAYHTQIQQAQNAPRYKQLHRLRCYAAVLLAEAEDISTPLVGPLVSLLSHHSAWYHRARIALCPVHGVRSHRGRFASRVGARCLEYVAMHAETSTSSFVIHTCIKFLAHSVVWDSPEMVKHWVGIVNEYDRANGMPHGIRSDVSASAAASSNMSDRNIYNIFSEEAANSVPESSVGELVLKTERYRMHAHSTPSALDAQVALRMLTSVEALTNEVWAEIRLVMQTTASLNVRRALLRQVMMMITVSRSLKVKQVRIFNNYTNYDKILTEFQNDMAEGKMSVVDLVHKDDQVLVGGPVEVGTSILFTLQESQTKLNANNSQTTVTDASSGVAMEMDSKGDDTRTSHPVQLDTAMLVQRCESLLQVHFGSTLGTMLTGKRYNYSKHILEQLRIISERNMYHFPSEELALGRYASCLVENNLAAFKLLLEWTIAALRAFAVEDENLTTLRTRGRYLFHGKVFIPGLIKTTLRHLLTLLAAAAESMPSTFLKITNWGQLHPLLVQLIHSPISCRTKRQASISILSLMHRINKPVFEALKRVCSEMALLSGPGVPSVADLASRFQIAELNLNVLFTGLYDTNSYIAYITSQILLAIGTHPSVSSDVQNQVVQALSEAANDPRSDRTIHPSHVVFKIPQLMKLQHAFVAALRNVLSCNSSLSPAEQQRLRGHVREEQVDVPGSTPDEDDAESDADADADADVDVDVDAGAGAGAGASSGAGADESVHADSGAATNATATSGSSADPIVSSNSNGDADTSTGAASSDSEPDASNVDIIATATAIGISPEEYTNLLQSIPHFGSSSTDHQVAIAEAVAQLRNMHEQNRLEDQRRAAEAAGLQNERRRQPGDEYFPSSQSPLTVVLFSLIKRNDEIGISRVLNLGASIYGQDADKKSLVEVAYESKCQFFIEEVFRRSMNDDPTCLVCMTNLIDVLFLPCTHMVVCHVCAPKLSNKCPTCRAPVRTFVDIDAKRVRDRANDSQLAK